MYPLINLFVLIRYLKITQHTKENISNFNWDHIPRREKYVLPMSNLIPESLDLSEIKHNSIYIDNQGVIPKIYDNFK